MDNGCGPPEATAPPSAIRWYMRRIKACWRLYDRTERHFHVEMLRRYPSTVRIAEWLLSFTYDVIASPAFGVILAFLLVGLVASETVTIIVSLSTFGAWLVFIVAVARYAKPLPILRRMLALVVFACISAVVSHLYVRWILASNAVHHLQETPHTPAVAVPAGNVDSILFNRLKELISDQMGKLQEHTARQKGSAIGPSDKDKSATGVSNLISRKIDTLRDFCGTWQQADRGHEEEIYDAELRLRNPNLPQAQSQEALDNARARKAEYDASMQDQLVRLTADVRDIQTTLISKVDRPTKEDEDMTAELNGLQLYQVGNAKDGWGCPPSTEIIGKYMETLVTRVR